jgi:hypothetical protein
VINESDRKWCAMCNIEVFDGESKCTNWVICSEYCRGRLDAYTELLRKIEPSLLEIADVIDEDEGPVILAWGVKQLATHLIKELGP